MAALWIDREMNWRVSLRWLKPHWLGTDFYMTNGLNQDGLNDPRTDETGETGETGHRRPIKNG